MVTTKDNVEVEFDLSETEIDNEGYVDLHIGREVEVSGPSKDERHHLKAL